jgi:lipopolysaccharide/colanic/teichoic acid biosynthesis glycosyltransferase
MSLVIAIIDTPLGSPGRSQRSLLAMPLGTRTIFDSLYEQSVEMAPLKMLVLAPIPDDGSYMKSLEAALPDTVSVVDETSWGGALSGCETSDRLLIIEARLWPVSGWQLNGLVSASANYRGATHYVAFGSSNANVMRERLQCNATGQVTRVQRLYDLVNWPESANAALACSVVPTWAAEGVSFGRLAELRSALAIRGVMSQDLPLGQDVVDLARERTLLAVNERLVLRRAARDEAPKNGRKHTTDHLLMPLVSAQARIHPSARLVEPVSVHPEAVIERNAVVIGPAVIGPKSRVGESAMVVQSVIGGNVQVPPAFVVRHRTVVDPAQLLDENPEEETEPTAEPPIPTGSDAEDALGPENLIEQNRRSIGRQVTLAIKRVFDITLSAVGLIALSPFLLLTAILVKLDSRGPVFFCHRREGLNGQEFPCCKFRTMVVDAHQKQRELYKGNQVDGPQFKMRNDPRITRVGKWLRATNIDELPQLFNVLLGHMSLVGPRPSPFRENQICVSWRRARLSVRPGITGLWQVCRAQDRSRGDFHEWIYYDISYVKHMSLWLDLAILASTFVSLGGKRSIPSFWLVPTSHWKSRPLPQSITG